MKGLKWLELLCPCTFISISVIVITIILTKNNVFGQKTNFVEEDLPSTKNLELYLSALERIVDFFTRNKDYLDLDARFGLFLVDVNLRKITNISSEIHSRFEGIFRKNDILADYYRSKIETSNHTEQEIKVALKFYNASTWRRPPDKFNYDLRNKTTMYNSQQLTEIYGSWEQYSDNMKKFESYNPTPSDIDECLAQLEQIEPLIWTDQSQGDCLTIPQCKDAILAGNEFGHSLSHRILYMVFARFSRRCDVFSKEEDKEVTDQFCIMGYCETEFISYNYFQLPDLMFEMIAFCALFGHAQFMRNEWIQRAMVFQNSIGCFSEEVDLNSLRRNDKIEEWNIKRQLTLVHGKCNGHFTGLAAAVLSSVLRFLVES